MLVNITSTLEQDLRPSEHYGQALLLALKVIAAVNFYASGPFKVTAQNCALSHGQQFTNM